MSGDWNWHDEESKGNIVVREVSAIAVYQNPDGDIVVRQQGYPEDDSMIIVPVFQLAVLIAALQEQLP